MTRVDPRCQGVVLLVVLFFALLLASALSTFARRSVIDAIVVRNREAVARTEALARGGIRLASAMVLQDKILKSESSFPADSHLDPWYQPFEFEVDEGFFLRIRVQDSGSRLNLNSLFDVLNGGVAFPQTEPFLQEFLQKVVDELRIPPGEKLYDINELAANLIDWVDVDEIRLSGGDEDDYYQRQEQPYRPSNRPLLSVDELLLIEGYDQVLVDGLRPYVTVYPFIGGAGINLNTAPTHVLALLYSNDGVDHRLADQNDVEQILMAREDEGLVCAEDLSDENCTPITTIMPNPIFPPPPTTSANTFMISAEARDGEIRRRVEAVVDFSSDVPVLLSWNIR